MWPFSLVTGLVGNFLSLLGGNATSKSTSRSEKDGVPMKIEAVLSNEDASLIILELSNPEKPEEWVRIFSIRLEVARIIFRLSYNLAEYDQLKGQTVQLNQTGRHEAEIGYDPPKEVAHLYGGDGMVWGKVNPFYPD